ncbi:MAG: PfkB family carbohydrate kinase [Atribacterota bacterium]
MVDVISIGECLIDFVSEEVDKPLHRCRRFIRAPGGAPANVAVGISKLGVKSGFIGRIGDDDFGKLLEDVLIKNNVDTKYVIKDKQTRTTLAFSAKKIKGEKEILFYRNPGADMMLEPEDLNEEYIKSSKLLFFGSVSLSSEPARETTKKAVECANRAGVKVLFDPNIRYGLWESSKQVKRVIKEFVPMCDIFKSGKQEIEFITGKKDLNTCTESIINQGPELAVVTLGKRGCFFNVGEERGKVDSFKVKTVDSLGSGDSFTASMIYKLIEENMLYRINRISRKNIKKILGFANAGGAFTSTKPGVIPALPEIEDIKNLFSGTGIKYN